MIRIAILLVAAGGFATGAQAQVRPFPVGGDPRLQAIYYHRDQVVQIAGSPGYQITIALAPDEQIQSVAVGDSTGWQVTANRSGNMLFVKPTQGGDTNMTVITNARFYAFDLVTAGAGGAAPYEVRFRYPTEAAANGVPQTAGPARIGGEYRLKGAHALRPTRMSDDGERTWIEWAPDALLPAVFIIDDHGKESLANGNMRGSFYVIDSVHDHLLFRIDRETVRADRHLPKAPKK
ncbi:MAG: hypothetical protein BGN95_04450 [Sphingomonas sp. 66-10]|uniref:TrbG/VirB9 family P-type conjugative transfer protein n=1 Tax=Sphingomonas sp. 66-10 TaxID=1895848 RepID=UPI00092C5E14|nr:TrbG/VirB9 family P-type conjugative transfer protein [Sphingomonas sp. 66-10]OJU14573.1 MAG: hypothetical protein BGN95_04450 [Sphingomonas sp. 66-10]